MTVKKTLFRGLAALSVGFTVACTSTDVHSASVPQEEYDGRFHRLELSGGKPLPSIPIEEGQLYKATDINFDFSAPKLRDETPVFPINVNRSDLERCDVDTESLYKEKLEGPWSLSLNLNKGSIIEISTRSDNQCGLLQSDELIGLRRDLTP